MPAKNTTVIAQHQVGGWWISTVVDDTTGRYETMVFRRPNPKGRTLGTVLEKYAYSEPEARVHHAVCLRVARSGKADWQLAPGARDY